MQKDDLEYIFVYRPDSYIINDLFAEFFDSDRIEPLRIYDDYSTFKANLRSAYTSGWTGSSLLCSWLIPSYRKHCSLIKELKRTSQGRKRCYIICESSIPFLSNRLLGEMSKREDIVMVLLLFDPVKMRHGSRRRKYDHFQGKNGLVMTFDFEDSKEYGYHLMRSYYSMRKPDYRGPAEEAVYFCGFDKGRLETICRIYDRLKSNGIECRFHVNMNGRSSPLLRADRSSIIENRMIPYPEVINQLAGCSCILDITQKGQTGVTVRYYEAVCYNKKLLTNNPNVGNLPFYDPEFMQIFDDPDGIDVEWIKRPVEVDYGYDGRFSPLRLLDAIPALLD